MITSLPDDIIVDILARVSRFNYPTLSLVSKHFRSLVASPHLYERRSLLGCTEACLYVMLFNGDTHDHEFRWYILHREANGNNRLILIPSLPRMPPTSSFLAVGLKFYVLGGVHSSRTIGEFSVVDCRSHMVQSLPSMPMRMIYKVAADIIDDKIYVIGGCESEKKNVMLVFNTKTQLWESNMTNLDVEIDNIGSRCIVVIGDKMYMRNSQNSFVYIPKENKLETNEMLNLKDWRNACVIGDILYYYDSPEKMLRAYDSKERRWGVVKGLESLPEAYPLLSNTVNYGEKLVLLFMRHKEIWCAEITLERCQEGEIWGNVSWVDNVVLNGDFSLWKSLSVMV